MRKCQNENSPNYRSNSLRCFPRAQRYCLVRLIFRLNNLKSHTNSVHDGVSVSLNMKSCQPLRGLNLLLAEGCHQVAKWLRLAPLDVPVVQHESMTSLAESIHLVYLLCHVIGPVKINPNQTFKGFVIFSFSFRWCVVYASVSHSRCVTWWHRQYLFFICSYLFL